MRTFLEKSFGLTPYSKFNGVYLTPIRAPVIYNIQIHFSNLFVTTFSEKKNERKAAKTLSAILLAFIVTWTPYSVLTVANAFLGKESADKYIPGVVWDFSYYLCYINSTVNPVLYALCNAAFRRTYVRILTCRWGGQSRQPYGNRYYYG